MRGLGASLPLVCLTAGIFLAITARLVFSNPNPLAVAALPQDLPKVFVIGLSKTGTTSLGDALARLGYRRSGWEDLRSRWLYWAWKNHAVAIGGQGTEDNHAEFSHNRTAAGALVSHTSRFSAFEDIPWALAYQEMAVLYPNAKFILTLRRDEQTWLRSAEAHTARRWWRGHREIYGCLEARRCPESYLQAYRTHQSGVRAFFAQRGEERRVLEFVIDGNLAGKKAGGNLDGKPGSDVDERWTRLVEFLGVGDMVEALGGTESLGPFPRSNDKASFGNRDPLGIFWAWDQILYRVETALDYSALLSRW